MLAGVDDPPEQRREGLVESGGPDGKLNGLSTGRPPCIEMEPRWRYPCEGLVSFVIIRFGETGRVLSD